MCGRFALYSDPCILAKRFSAEVPQDWQPRYNIAPTQNLLIVREDDDKRRRFALTRWGLIPRWSKAIDMDYSTINARAETVANKPAFREAFRRRRCLIPADGYYEWQVVLGSKTKQPWFMTLRSRLPMALAGLWERWRSPKGEELESCSIIVTEANESIRPIHDRMPVILAPGDWNTWLEAEAYESRSLQVLLKPYTPESMMAWRVSTIVNSPLHDSAACLAALNA